MPKVNSRFEIASCVIDNGDSVADVAEHYAIQPATVRLYVYLRRAGRLPQYNAPRAESARDVVRQLLAEGKTRKEIAAITGFKYGTIAAYDWEWRQAPAPVSRFATDKNCHNVPSQTDTNCHDAPQDIDSDPALQ